MKCLCYFLLTLFWVVDLYVWLFRNEWYEDLYVFFFVLFARQEWQSVCIQVHGMQFHCECRFPLMRYMAHGPRAHIEIHNTISVVGILFSADTILFFLVRFLWLQHVNTKRFARISYTARLQRTRTIRIECFFFLLSLFFFLLTIAFTWNWLLIPGF